MVGEDNNPVVGADVSVQFNISAPPSQSGQGVSWDQIKGLTDSDEAFSVSHTDNSWSLAIVVNKVGYYSSHVGHELYVPGQFDDGTVSASRNATITLVLKKNGEPIAMYAEKAQTEVPQVETPIGFDLTVGDWVGPYGKGLQSDFIFTAHRRWTSRNDFDESINISFPNPGEGLFPIAVPSDQGSALCLSAVTPEKNYLAGLTRTLSHR